MWLLAFKIKAFCPFCLVSAFLSFSMAAITWRTQVVTSATKSAVRWTGGQARGESVD
jgi:uncharacterized membrane protein